MVQNEWNIYYCIYNMNHFEMVHLHHENKESIQ